MTSDRFTIAYEEDDFVGESEKSAQTSRALGDITTYYDRCGSFGLCPECQAKGATEPCQQRYIAARIRGQPDE